MLAFETLLMILVFYKAAVMWKENAGLAGFSLIKVLVRDQAVYFVTCGFLFFRARRQWNWLLRCIRIVVISLIQILINNLRLGIALNCILGLIGNPAFLPLLGSRLLVHMKEASKHQDESYEPRVISHGIIFADRVTEDGSRVLTIIVDGGAGSEGTWTCT